MEKKVNQKLDDKKTKAKAEKSVKKTDKPAKSQVKVVSEVKAKARFIKIAPRKTRLVINQLRGLSADQAISQLQFITKAAVKPVRKLVNSAIANAENNFGLDKKDLYIKKIIANDGPTLKRWQPRAYGRSTMINKRTSHIEVVLGVKEGAKQKVVVKKESKPEDIKIVSPDEVKKEGPKNQGNGPEEKGQDGKGFLKGVFQRKTG